MDEINIYRSTKNSRATAPDSVVTPTVDLDVNNGAIPGSLQDSNFKNEVKNMKKRADNLLPGEGKAPKDAIEYFVKAQYALAQTEKNPWYRLAMKISAFSGEPMTKMWKTQAQVETGQALLQESSQGLYSAIDSSAGNYEGGDLVQAMGSYMEQQSEQNVSEYVKNRRDFNLSPQVFGKLFLTPLMFGHINESVELIKNHCGANVDVHHLIESTHQTMFARLVALRMQMSRFLSGRYYSLSGNYGRLMHQTNRVIMYFKSYYKPGSSGARLQYSRMIPTRTGAVQNQNLNYQVPSLPSRSSYFEKLNRV